MPFSVKYAKKMYACIVCYLTSQTDTQFDTSSKTPGSFEIYSLCFLKLIPIQCSIGTCILMNLWVELWTKAVCDLTEVMSIWHTEAFGPGNPSS
jgi:hypothetical protein